MLQIEHVSKKIDTFSLQDISFELPKGYIMGLIGLNGAGKSTLMKLILNVLQKIVDVYMIPYLQERKFGCRWHLHWLIIPNCYC